jgi:5-methylcytosine-specific restriction enzyme subunit McrC
MSVVQWLELEEEIVCEFGNEELPPEVGEEICRRYSRWLDVEFPSPKTNNRWRIRAKGWVGYMPLAGGRGIYVRPKVPVTNLFQMMEVAYDLISLRLFEGRAEVASLPGFYERVVESLAVRVLRRARQGFYQAYVAREEVLPYIRGRWRAGDYPRHPARPGFACAFEEMVVDNEENQIILWTLHHVMKSGYCQRPEVLSAVRKAYQAMEAGVSLRRFTAADCANRNYHRLNRDYAPMHTLCQFLLDASGPSHVRGDRIFTPFALNMPRLYERFVTEWLKRNLPEQFQLVTQEAASISSKRTWVMDALIYRREPWTVHWLVDLKYKRDREPKNGDLFQLTAYAAAKGCKEAVLVYPGRARTAKLTVGVSGIQVRVLNFPLDGDLDQAGNQFMRALIER